MSSTIGKALLSGKNLIKAYGSQPILDDISLTIHEGDRIGLIGRNGCGKSTLMRILAGLDNPDGGEVTRAQNLSIALLAQECSLDRSMSIGTVLKSAAADRVALLDDYHEAMSSLAEGPPTGPEHDELQAQCDTLQHQVDAAAAWDIPTEVKRIHVALRLPDDARTLDTLSGGELRRVDLAHKLLQHPDVLLLDEPTNHIDTYSVEWIERFLERYEGCCMLVTHDRYFLDRVVNRIVELEFNTVYSFPGNYERFLEYKAQVEWSEARAEDNRQAMIRRELVWYRRGAKARSTKQKARIQRLDDAIDMGTPSKHREFTFEIPESEPLSKTILEARKITHGYGDETLFKDFNFLMQKGMRVGILGPNGSGKTTLLRVLMGQEEAKKGKLIIGDSTQFLYVDQAHADMDPYMRILDFVSNGVKQWDTGTKKLYIPAYLERFLFDKSCVDMPIANLSGGERNRLDLVRKLLRGGNLLVLDEPTNDLDLYTLRILEESIDAFNGCAVIVSHDRYFLNRVCTHLLLFEEDGHIQEIVGNYDDYLLYKKRKQEDAKAVAPKEKPKTAASDTPAQTEKRRLSYNEKRELEGMEEAILEAEEAVSQLENTMAAPGFYEQDHTQVQEVVKNLESVKTHVEILYARWEELSALQ